jgi:FixJ family two-component response regulator
MSNDQATVIVVDDDQGVRDGLDSLLRSVGFNCRSYGSVAEFGAAKLPDGPRCLVLDVRLPGKSGLDLQGELVDSHIDMPIIFVTGHGDIPMTVRAMKAGAVEFLTKPFREQELLDAIQVALGRDRDRRTHEAEMAALRPRFDSLSQRERQVMAHVIKGQLNKQIAGALELSEITVKVHRGNMMRKMGVRSVAELVTIASRLADSGIAP